PLSHACSTEPGLHRSGVARRTSERHTTRLVMGTAIESFEEATALPTAALRALLDSPRPEQRVWALWALALRASGPVTELAQRTAIEPTPGVRRTLAVILASHGETDLLVALSRHDPVIAVRESAMQLVTRLAAGGIIDRGVVLDAARGEPAIQTAILAAINAAAPDFLVDLAGRLLTSATPAVQLEAVEALVRCDRPAARAHVIEWLRVAEEGQATEGCRRWARAAGIESLVRELAPIPILPVIALRALHAPDWRIVELLARGDDQLLRVAALRPDIAPPVHVLGRMVLAGPPSRVIERLSTKLMDLPAAPEDFIPLVPRLLQYCRQQLGIHRAELALVSQRLLASDGDARTGRREGLLHSVSIESLAKLRFQLERLASELAN
ncbi:MAG: hypothetical protein ACRDMZ_07945, partial [Solirubrobacteraceae bacterium]